MQIIHKKASDLTQNEWDQIKTLNQKIIPASLYDQNLFNGGCLKSTCDKAMKNAIETGTTEVLLGFEGDVLISYMIFYCKDTPSSLQARLDNYNHLGQVGYSDMLVVHPDYRNRGYSQQMRSCMKEIARKEGVDVFMTFVRGIPIPNIPSLMSLRKAGAVCGKNLLLLERPLEGSSEVIKDICFEMVYPTNDRVLTTDSMGNIKGSV